MAHVMVNHDVADFDTWKTAFDEHESMRQESSISVTGLYRGKDNPNNVTVMMSGNDDNLNSFMDSEELKEAMQKAGVVSQPNIWMLDKVD